MWSPATSVHRSPEVVITGGLIPGHIIYIGATKKTVSEASDNGGSCTRDTALTNIALDGMEVLPSITGPGQ